MLDRLERGRGEKSAVQELRDEFGIPVVAVATLDDLMGFIALQPQLAGHAPAIGAYREQYGTR